MLDYYQCPYCEGISRDPKDIAEGQCIYCTKKLIDQDENGVSVQIEKRGPKKKTTYNKQVKQSLDIIYRAIDTSHFLYRTNNLDERIYEERLRQLRLFKVALNRILEKGGRGE